MSRANDARAPAVLALLGLLTLALLLWRGSQRPQRPPGAPDPRASLLFVVPRDTALLVTADVPRLAAHDAGRALLGEGRSLLPRGEDDCAIDPARDLSSFAVVLPAGARREELGVVALLAEEALGRLAPCAERLLQGGGTTRSRLGSFALLRTPGVTREVAVRDDGLLLLSEGRFLHDLVDAADGRAPSVDAEPMHRELRRRLGAQGALQVSLVLAPGWVDRFLPDPGRDSARTPLSEVRGGALRLELGDRVGLFAVLACARADACEEIAGQIEELRGVGRSFDLRLGVPVFERLRPRAEPHQLTLELALTAEELGTLVRVVARLAR